MSYTANIRWGWLKFMYIYTVIGAGGFGLGMLFAPRLLQAAFGFPSQDPVVFGLAGSVYTAFGLTAILGIKSPLKFLPILFLQLLYKSIWLLAVILPLLFTGQIPGYAIILLLIFSTYIVGDLIAIPFACVVSDDQDS